MLTHDPARQLLDRAHLADFRRRGRIHAQGAGGRGEGARPERRLRQGGRLLRRNLGAAEHIGASPDLAADQPALAQQRVGAPHSADGDAEIEGEIALRRKLCAGRQHAAADVGLGPIRQAKIEGAGLGGEIGKPICHGDNLYIEPGEGVNA